MHAMPTSFASHLLIAMPAMDDPNFRHAVALLCQHDEGGAMGIVINRVSEYTLGELLAQMDIVAGDAALADAGVLTGGPVQPERGFVLHDDPREWNSTLRLAPGLAVTTSRDILDAMARGDGPQNSWLTVPADDAILFRTPLAERWQAATRGLGFDPGHLSSTAGHA